MTIDDGLNPKNKHSEKVSIYAGVWKMMLKGFFHECYHAHSAILEPHAIRFDKEFREEDELLAPIFAKDVLFDLAKKMNIEIDFTPEVSAMIDKALTNTIERIENNDKATKSEKAWIYHQKYLLEHGGIFYAPSTDKDSEDYHLMTFKEFLHFFSADAEDDAAWNIDTIGIIATETGTHCNENANTNGNVPSTIITPMTGTYEYEDMDEYDPYPNENDFGNDFDAAVAAAPVPGFQGIQQAINPVSAQMQEPVAPVSVSPIAPNSNPKGAQVITQPGTAPLAPVAPEVPVVAGAAGVGTAFVLSVGADAQTVVNGLYLKMFTQIFQGCQYSPFMPMPFPGGGNITQWLELTEDEAKFVVSMTMYSTDPAQRGKLVADTPVDRHISGIMIDKAGTLPGYKLVLAMPDGTVVKRNFFPQNPNKVSESGYVSEPAKLAKAGGCIMWIVDADTKEYKLRIRDGHFERNLGNYKWGV